VAGIRHWYAPFVLLFGWSAFSLGLLWQFQSRYQPLAETPHVWVANGLILALCPAAIWALAVLLWRTRPGWWPAIERQLEAHTDAIDSIPAGRVWAWIAVTAGVGLFAELMIIRIHASFFQLFAYYKNLSLLSCFLGLGIGYALGSHRRVCTPLLLPGLAFQILLLHSLRLFGVSHLLQNPVLEQSGLGIGQVAASSQALTVYGFLLAVFASNALCFIPLGHLTSRLMLRRDKLAAYGWNLIGSLLGILLFSLASFAWTPPSVWILVPAAALLLLLRRHPIQLCLGGASVGILVAVMGMSVGPHTVDIYSPYQILTLDFRDPSATSVSVNNAYFQRMLDLRAESVERNSLRKTWADYYSIPYLVKPSPRDVLVVGAGTGNDVAAALRNGAGRVDAVEIDPVIQEIGRALHPEAPYSSRRVTTVVDDARSFMRHTARKYDLIVYGLLDSHTLLSGISEVRLDSYVYTVEAFREARRLLREGGVICLTFTLVSEPIGRKLFLMLRDAFDGVTPRVLWSNYDKGVTFLISEDPARASDRSGEGGSGSPVRAFRVPERMREATRTFADPRIEAEVSTDDWPFLYMPVRAYPLYYVAVIGVLLWASLLLIGHFLPGSGSGFSLPCFFLGAGFMLLETKSITELALVFGSTWVVVSAVVAAILVMAFLANLLISSVERPPAVAVYALLLVALLVCWQLSGLDWSGLSSGWHRFWMTIFLTAPLFFAGLAFSTELKTSASVPAALSANLIGSMLGGFLEYNAMYFGFESLWFLGIAMYAAAFAGRFVQRGTLQPAK
jgi:SAM-dependent methyltransferase